ncbi:hypothetical protein HDU76_005232 [Blyttiomyces sp. JEL0837]|nr:hypothetical protein HDU76_005232 [Blyttiomyces sp. JEL0837]
MGCAWAEAQTQMGRPLYSIKKDWSKLLTLRAAVTLETQKVRISLAMQVIECLSGNTDNAFEAKGEWFVDEQDSQTIKHATLGYIGNMVIWGLLYGVLAFWSRDWHRCHSLMSKARSDYSKIKHVHICYKMWPFYDAISSFGMLHIIKTKGRLLFHTNSDCLVHLKPAREYMTIVKHGLKSLKRMAKWTPQTEAHRYHLLLAEKERLKLTHTNRRKAVSLYREAARLAVQNGFPNEAGLANELCSQYLESLGEPREEFLGYLKESLKFYDEWGSPPLVQQMLRAYPYLQEREIKHTANLQGFSQTKHSSKDKEVTRGSHSKKAVTMRQSIQETDITSRDSDPTSPTDENSDLKAFKLLDFISVLKASQNISGQQTLENTLKATLKAILENSGASRAALFQYSSSKLIMLCEESVVEAKSVEVPGDFISGGRSPKISGRRDVLRSKNMNSKLGITISNRVPSGTMPGPLSLLNYVARTNLTVILNDASISEFADDPYFFSKGMKSILCTPLTGYSGVDLQLMVYMEHPTVGVFTGDRVEVSKILLQQAAFDIDKTQTADAVARFVPTELLSLLGIKSVKNAALGDAVEKVMTIFFADIRDFTTLSEKMSPSECFKFVNQLLGALVPQLTGNGLVVDKFIGDAIMALSADSDSQIGAENAVRAGIDMQRRLSIFNEANGRVHNNMVIRLGIGIHTGSTMLGLLGSTDRINVTVISDSVNSASRVESITKRYGATMVISDSTYKLLPNPDAFSIRVLDDIIVKGQSKPLRIYEVMEAEPDEDIKNRKIQLTALYEAGLEEYRGGNIANAYEIFQRVLDMYADDVPTKLFLERCEYWLQQGMPEEWNPIWVMKDK